MESRQSIEAIVGRGLEGDRYLHGSGHWSSKPGVGRQVTLIEIESIEALEREKNIVITPGGSWRNLDAALKAAALHSSLMPFCEFLFPI